MKRIFLMVVFSVLIHPVAAETCQTWFKNTGIKKDEDCLLECVSARTDMGTFHCSELCVQLCESPEKERIIFNLSYLYPGLTKEERALSAKYPKKVLSAYKLSRKANDLCLTVFRASGTNDASDACRHFVWAALLYQKFGLDFSRKILDAHEQDRKQPSEEKAMDLANNRLGVIMAKQLLRENKLNETAILQSFLNNLKKGNLIVLKKNTRKKSRGKK